MTIDRVVTVSIDTMYATIDVATFYHHHPPPMNMTRPGADIPLPRLPVPLLLPWHQCCLRYPFPSCCKESWGGATGRKGREEGAKMMPLLSGYEASRTALEVGVALGGAPL